jgi:Ca-activated chloride channel homolog
MFPGAFSRYYQGEIEYWVIPGTSVPIWGSAKLSRATIVSYTSTKSRMKRTSKKWAAAMLVAVSCWASVSAQVAEDVVRVDIALVTVNVAVTDGKGRHISELKVGDFFVSDEGKPVRLEFFDTQGPTSIIFVVDVSSSMRGEKWKSLMAGMKKFLANAREGNDYTLISFNEAPRLIARSVSAQDLWREFSSLKPSGNTALYDAILLGLTTLERVPQRHKSLVLLSDGQDNSSAATLRTVHQEMLAHRASIYTVGLGIHGYNFPATEPQARELLNQLAKATGGLVFFPRPDEIRTVLVGINADLSSRYSLSYYPPDKTPGWRRIQVNLTPSHSRLSLRYQQQYLIR